MPDKSKKRKQWSDEELAVSLELIDLETMLGGGKDGYEPDQIADPETRRLWVEARAALAAVRARLDAAWVDKD